MEHWFDDLARLTAREVSRREALGWLGRRLGGLALLAWFPGDRGQEFDEKGCYVGWKDVPCGDTCCFYGWRCCCPGVCEPPVPAYCEDVECPAEPSEDVFSVETEKPPEGEMPADEPPADDVFGVEIPEEEFTPDFPEAQPPPEGPPPGEPPEFEPPPEPGPGPEVNPEGGVSPEGGPEEGLCYGPEEVAPEGRRHGQPAFRAQPHCPAPPCPAGLRRCPRAEEPYYGECCPSAKQCCDFGQCCDPGSECRPIGRGRRRVCVEQCTEFERRCPTAAGAFGRCCTSDRECCDGGVCCEPGATCVPVAGGGRECVFPGREEVFEAEAPPTVPACLDNERRCPAPIGSDLVGQCCPWGQDCCADGICCSPGIACWFGRFCAE